VDGIDIGERCGAMRWGGFSEVYRGWYNNSHVALKKLKISDWTERRKDVHKVGAASLFDNSTTER
jgi:hypothetical protein